ncbi:MAG: tyrosine-type recombinase/integrase [Oscillospiraceae bacterium]|jgi:site-specific recombinase XerD|nr:tyrosine-type recombinase/integrase [Oscillospiraceae bacterium]
MRFPNGYGSVVKLSGNRRKPYMARKTAAWNEKGHPIYKPIGYFQTREEALIALAQFNHKPYDIDKSKVTLLELFELWKEKKVVKLGDENFRHLCSSFNHCKTLQNKIFREIKAYHMQETIDNCGHGYSTQGGIKNLWGHLDDFAVELDITTTRYSELLTSDPVPPTSRDIFSKEEVNLLWENLDMPFVDTVLIFIYAGWRISELLNLKKDDIDLEAGIMRGGLKTNAGRDRIVPIHSLIFDFVKKRYLESNTYLIEINGKKCSHYKYYSAWWKIMNNLNISKTPHECRHTFESLLDSAKANRKCIDLMVGHVSKGTGERVYTHKTTEELKAEIELVTR